MYGQSRSRFFSERFNEMGIIANFCGYHKEADIIINKNLVDSYDIIVILDKYFEKDFFIFNYIVETKPFILHYIDDFSEKFNDEIEKIYNEILVELEVTTNGN